MKIAYTGSHFPKRVWQGVKGYINGQGYEVDMIKLSVKNAQAHKDDLKGYGIIICSGEAYDGDTIRYLASHGLRMLSRHGVGTDEIDKETATGLGIAITNAAGTLSASVAECALALTLMVLRQFSFLDRRMREGYWDGKTHFLSELRNKTVGLIGFGGIAQQFAYYLSPFDCRLLAYDPLFNKEKGERLLVLEASLDEICAQSDVISLHLPLTDETRGMVDIQFMKKMKREAILINTSRGAIINEADLCEALQAGLIAGAGLDVYESEPLGTVSPLLHMDNAVLLPHVAAHTYESQLDAGLMACRNAVNFIRGIPPESLVNPGYAKFAQNANNAQRLRCAQKKG